VLPCFVVIDLETTGGNALHDRITEIAAVRIENGQEVARWSTLVNPGVRIPTFIQSLTGISDAMVQEAPRFEDVAPRLLELLDGAVFVAHNVRFDHGFVLHALERMEKPFKVKTLCTVRLSRKLYPAHKGHGLDALSQRHGLHTVARHRAMGDVELVLAFLAVARAELGAEVLQREAKALLQGSASVPPQLQTPIESVPDTPGVYVFYGEGDIPLYIGKSVTLRTRVMSHFQASSRQAREMRILQEIRRIEWQETAGELGALLLESRWVKERQPIHNRLLRRTRGLRAWQLSDKHDAKPLLTLVGLDEIAAADMGSLYGAYRSKRQAHDALRQLCDAHALCPQALGLESGKGACFASQIGKCKGVCAGRESATVHWLRLQLALRGEQLQAWPFTGPVGIREFDARSGRTDIHVFDQWCHLATVHDEDALAEALRTRQPLAFDIDTYRLLLKRLSGAGRRDVLQLARPPEASAF
jgi:DNA polymerase-3 subunit epsilon